MFIILLTLAILSICNYLRIIFWRTFFCTWVRISDTATPAANINIADIGVVIKVYSCDHGQMMYLTISSNQVVVISDYYKLTRYSGTPHDMIYAGGLDVPIEKTVALLNDILDNYNYNGQAIKLPPCDYDEYKTLNYL